MNRSSLFDRYRLGQQDLKNRIVMAPMTRARSLQPGNIPSALMAEYYRQRATAGLIIAEASPISPLAQGYLDTPGIWSAEQVAAWREVTSAVHGEGGKIVLQLWHVGRISHSSLLPDGAKREVGSGRQTRPVCSRWSMKALSSRPATAACS